MRLYRPFTRLIRDTPARLLFVSVASLACAGTLAGGPFTTIFAEENTVRVAKAPAGVTTKPDPGEVKPANGLAQQRQGSSSRQSFAGWRDPFRTNPPRHTQAPPAKLKRLPGIGGLVIGELQLRGLVEEKTSHKVVAVVTDGGTLAYFLHENDQLYDGTVTRITPTAVYLARKTMPSGPNPAAGSVVLRLQPEPGDNP